MSRWRRSLLRGVARAAWGLDARELAWRPAGQLAPARHAAHAEALPAALAQLAPGAGVDVIAANDMAVHWLQTPPSSAASLDELRRVAAARCAHLHGGSPKDWWVAADWNATEPFVCAALPQSMVAPVQQRLAAAGISARWHTAWGVACGCDPNPFPANGWSALRSPTRVMLWHCNGGRVDCLGVLSVCADTADPDAGALAVQRIRIESLRQASLANEPPHWVSTASRDDAVVNEALAALELGAWLEGVAS